MQFGDLFRAIRITNSILAGIAVFVGASIAILAPALQVPVIIGMLAAFLVCAAGQIINDYFDFELDLKKGKQKYESVTKENKKQLLWIAIALFLVGNALAYFINQNAFLIAIGISVLLIIYSAILQKQKWLGNLVVALGTALPLVFGAAIFGDFAVIGWLAASAFLANWAREIVKDVEDLEADQGYKTTLPMLFKMSTVDSIVALTVFLAIILSYAPVFLNWYGNSAYLFLVTIANILFLKAFWEFRGFKAKKAKQSFKIAMAIALLGFLAGVL
jgi:geranylgeranylglycerol-phosphate geranylgeranyltransferase